MGLNCSKRASDLALIIGYKQLSLPKYPTVCLYMIRQVVVTRHKPYDKFTTQEKQEFKTTTAVMQTMSNLLHRLNEMLAHETNGTKVRIEPQYYSKLAELFPVDTIGKGVILLSTIHNISDQAVLIVDL
ncbi:unnamed protein product [Bubo scandiacus]